MRTRTFGAAVCVTAASLLSLPLISLPLLAQSGSGELTGRILDPAGAAVANAQIRLVETTTGIAETGQATATGDYNFIALNPGVYELIVTANGFKLLDRKGITIITGERTRLDLPLPVGGAQDTVTVTADAPLLQSESGAIETFVPQREILDLPLNGRNIVNLIALAPGVSLPVGTQLPRINGGRPRTNEYLYDGISALQPEPGQVAFFPIIDDIQEFNIESSGVSAEFGRFNGGVVNVTTRAGSNQLHGDVYEFLRNEALNTRNYFAPVNSDGSLQRKPLYRRNQYGASLGGPVTLFPGSRLKDRLFFFGDYQGTNQAVGVVRTSSVPTLAQRGNPGANGAPTTGLRGFAGTTAGTLARIYDPATTGVNNQRREFTGDTIPINRIDPAALALLERFPLPTNAAATNNYTRVGNDSDHQNQFDARLDGVITKHDQAFGRYTYFHDVENPVTPLPDGSGIIAGTVLNTGNVIGLSNTLGQQFVGNETHTFGARTLNEARFGYTRRSLTRSGATLGTGTASSALGIPGIPNNAAFGNALPVFSIANYTQIGPTASSFSNFSTSVTQYFDVVSHSIRAHSLKFGVDIRREALDALQPPNPAGSFGFAALFTDQPGIGTTQRASGGNALADFLLGQVNNFSIDLQQSVLQPRAHIFEAFVQDDWRATDRLTINAGLRYTINFASTEKNNQGAVFNLATQQYQYLGQNGFPRSARNTHYDNFGPRLGISYLATPKTVIRSGYGLVFIEQTGITTPFTTPQFPFLQTVQQQTLDSIHPAFALSAGPSVAPIALNANAGLGQGVFTVDRNLGSGYVQQWNLAIERALTSNLTATIGYTGSVITRVGIPDTNLNQLTAGQLSLGTALTASVQNPYFGQIPVSSSIGGRTVSAAQLLRPYPEYLTVASFRRNTGRTSYNAAELKVQQRTAYGLDFLLSYTYSKLIDDASSVFDSSVLTGPVANYPVADSFNPRLERDASTGDAPNTTVGSVVYRIPLGRNHRFGSSALGQLLLGGFEGNTVITVQSGMPFALADSTNFNAFAGFGTQRPTYNPNLGPANLPAAVRTPAHFINTAAFTVTPQFQLGNASRNPVRGPAYRDGDVSLTKRTALGAESRTLELRAEIFNLTNTPAFAQPNGTVGSAAFGSITQTAGEPRVVQFGAKIYY